MKKQKFITLLILGLLALSFLSSISKVAGAEVVAASYGIANDSTVVGLKAVHPSATTSPSASAQAFKTLDDFTLTGITVYLQKSNSPVAVISCAVYLATGTYETAAIPTGAAIEVSSTTYQASTLSAAGAEAKHFEFSGSTILYSGTVFEIVVYISSATTIDSTNQVWVHVDGSPAYAGNFARYLSSAFTTYANDLIFYVYGVSTETTLIDSCPTSYYAGDASYINRPHPNTDALKSSGQGQSFAIGSTYDIAAVTFYLGKVGNPAGAIYAKIYAHLGTLGTDSSAVTTLLATSQELPISTISSSLGLVSFAFSDCTLTAGNYWVVVQAYGDSGGLNDANYILIANNDNSDANLIHVGCQTWYNGAWDIDENTDTIFYLWEGSGLMPTATPSATPPQDTALDGAITPLLELFFGPGGNGLGLGIALIIILICAIIGAKFGGPWGFFAGLNVGVILCTVFGILAVWAVVLMGMMDIALVIGKGTLGHKDEGANKIEGAG